MNINQAVLEAMTFVELIPGAAQGLNIHDPVNRQAAYDFCLDEALRLAQQNTCKPAPRPDMQSLELWQAMCCHATLNEFHRCLKRLQAA
ncbi:hypothetical protein [Pseudomonas fluorescens]|uniref:Uncharacterized protein n=1 Tax=Pseudomonas fluorescens TaxID=294 RepID=A0A0F4VEW3_PSEFL|nr:hypothetical protein [Pseudomonas fluorescens]KJZ67264.1 hypothetical protein VD17_03115 [Pseudomonas fluorescens]